MKAVILVGGEGTRLRPLTLNCLKSAVPMVGRPFLEYPLAWLRKHGVREVVLSICHMPEKIRRVFGDGRRLGMKLRYAVETTPLGTAGAMKNAEAWVAGREPVAVLNGDQLTDLDLTRMLAVHQRQKALLTIGLTWVQDPSAFGSVQTDRMGRIQRFVEKAEASPEQSHWVNSGVYILDPAALAYIPGGVNCSAERQFFPNLLSSGQRVWSFNNRNYWIDIGTPAKYLQSHFDILEGRMFMLPVGLAWKRRPGLRVGRACRIHPEAELTAPAVVADSCRVDAASRVGELTVLGRGVHVGAHARIERSVIWDRVQIGEGAQLEECIVASGCQIGKFARLKPGTVLGENAVVPDYSRA